MSFDAAVSLDQLLGTLVTLLWLLLPITGLVSIRRRRRNRPGSSCWFAYLTLVVWGMSLIACVALFASGRWYGENGPPPQQVVIPTVVLLAIIVGIYLLLMALGSPERERTDAT